ncbi:MAG: hypothetical protein JWQ07_2134 [Ramlibacter sp.]|nr:hypothetical protein [Ramlibacter sp.]
MGQQQSMEKPHWRATALAIAAAVLLGVSASDANALALGRVTVQSALGEPLRADIDIPEITAEEVASLRAAVASPEAFRAAGFDFNPSLSGIQITLQRRPDGRHFLQLTSTRPVNDPFIDLILEANWASGRIVRDYTMLFDPPTLRQSAPPVAAQVSPAAPPARAPAATEPRTSAAPSAAPVTSGRAAGQRLAPAPAAPAPKPASGDSKQVTVQNGDTAGKIAAAHKPPSVSLDQMLVAMLRANPDAFVGGNVNRLRAGAVLDLPTGEEVGLVPSTDANQTIIAQSRDFNEFRRRLAEGLPTTQIGAADRKSSGKVQAQVEEKKPAAATPDKLTLSKGAVQGTAAADKIARDRAAQDAATRVAELNKNISDLNRLGTATAPAGGASAGKPAVGLPVGAASAAKPAPAPTAAPVAAAPAAKPASALAAMASAAKPAVTASAVAAPMAAPASAAKPASAPAVAAAAMASAPVAAAAPGAAASAAPPVAAATAASAPASAAVAGASAPAPASQAPASAAVAATAAAAAASKPRAATPPPETSLLDDLLENPIVPATVGGVLALLLGFGFYRAQQRKKSTQVDSSFLESRLQPDSFFGASGGQRIDTNEGSPTGSSMVYSPSQLDAAGDVDPVAEADVYLAYGRDLQAEEILKEAMRTTPQRVAVHSKLLEIYSKRRDAKAFELVATEAYGLTHGEGPEWEHICELGQELDPSNPLYRPGGHPAEGAAVAAGANFGATQATSTAASTQAMPSAPAVDLDLDLDFSIGDDAPAAGPAPAPTAAAPAPQPTLTMTVPPAAADQPMPALDMDFGAVTATPAAPAVAAAPVSLELPPVAQTEPARLDAPELTLPENSLAFTTDPPKAPSPPPPSPAAAAPAPAAADTGMIEFDLGALSLDLGTPATAAPAPAASAPAPKAAAPAEPEAEDSMLSTAGAPLSTGGFEDTGGGDPLATKLALAQEFNAIGDPDGARSLAEEVVAEASGDLKNKAQKFLAEIG